MPLPLKYRLALREHWDQPDGPAPKALRKLKEALGRDVNCEPQWDLLVAELGPQYESQALNVVIIIAGLVQSWCEAARQLIEDDANGTWADQLLERIMEGSSTLNFSVEVSQNNLNRAQTHWDQRRAGFNLLLPKVPITLPLDSIPHLKEDLLRAWEDKPASRDGKEPSGDSPAPRTQSEDKLPHRSPAPPREGNEAHVNYLPNVDALPRPDELTHEPPYHLFVEAFGDRHLKITSNHSPSLEVLEAYLTKWCRTNNHLSHRPPGLNINLGKGSFGLGLLHDQLTIEAEREPWHVSPTLILHLVERFLGYEMVHRSGNAWQFRRDTALRTL